MAADQQEAVLKRAVQRGLDNYTLGNATFLAERLLAVRHCAEHVHLLATCYYRAGGSRCVVHSRCQRDPYRSLQEEESLTEASSFS